MSLWQTWWTRAAGMRAIESTQRARLEVLVAYARAHSPWYRDAYRDLPDNPSLAMLPATSKHALMARFEDWVTDRAIHRSDIDAFVADRSNVGQRFLGRYAIWKSSGTSGEPGIYVEDAQALSVYDSLIAVQLASLDLATRCASGLMRNGGRSALVAATGDHFASIASWERVCRAAPGLAARGFSIMEPLDRLVAQLNDFAPAFLASYPTMLTVLAEERRAGRLHIAPSLIWAGGEYLGPVTQAQLERAFGCPVENEYGASECMSIAFGCRAGWLHVNADWVIVEPVDVDYQPVAPGLTSSTVLITNLANRVQPIIRYDLGDAVLANPDPCACGNPLPAIRVQGRRDDVIAMADAHGHRVPLVPLALTTVVEHAIDTHRFQIVQTAGDRLALRLDTPSAVARRAAFERASAALRAYVADQGIVHPHITLDVRPPVRDRSGKLRQVIAQIRQ